MRTLVGKRVLITGGASGIGKALAVRLARERARLLLADVNADQLASTTAELTRQGAEVQPLTVDVTSPEAILQLRDEVHRVGGPIDVLVNNAGVVFGGAFDKVPLERHFTTYRVNVLGLVAMTQAFLPDLIARPESHLVNMASASGLLGLPFGAVYASSKWAVIGFSESLRLELDMQGHRHVHVTIACPSYVTTGLFDGVRAPFLTRMLTPEVLADRMTRAVLRDALWVRTPWLVKTGPLLKGILPTRLFYAVASALRVNTSMVEWKGRDA
ncbi:MAG: SDR family NAD(P)-dependent oxidoreductase [Vicinamibacterales bacterium]